MGEVAAHKRAAVLTVSDRSYRGERADASGDALVGYLEEAGFAVIERGIVPDDREAIAARIREYVDQDVPLIVTTGGTGFGPRDVTPEATRLVIEREAPGLVEEMRRSGLAETPFAILSRAAAGIRGKSLIINLPGKPEGAVASLRSVMNVLAHALDVLRRPFFDHG